MMSTVFGYDPGNTNGWGLNSNGDNSTVVHEVGHYFNLFHTFQGDDPINDGVYDDVCPLDTTVGVDSDGCADTEPHKRETSSCPINNSCTGSAWLNNNTINNIMSYYNCADLLTNDQKIRARAAMEGTLIASSKGAEPLDPSYAPPVAVCLTNSAPSNNFAGIINVELNGREFSSSSTGNDGGNIDQTGNCSSYFEIDASVSNTLNVEVGANFNQLGVWIDWNDDGDFNDDMEQQYFAQDIPDSAIVPIAISYPTLVPFGDYVRLRLILDLDDRYGIGLINSPCYTSLFYGQSEDYTIYIEQGSTTYTYSNGWLPSNPIGVATASDDILINVGTANISANTTCNSIVVNPGAALTVDSGVTVTASTIDLNSDSSLYSSLILDGTILGTINYHRYVSMIGSSGTPGGNDLVSIPVMPVTGLDFEELTLQGNPANSTKIAMNPSETFFAFGPYDNSSNLQFVNYETYNGNLPPSPGNPPSLLKGKGYRAATSIGENLTFSGAAETGTVTIGVSTPTGGSQWNLIGNPYPSYIDASSFLMSTANIAALDGSGTAIYAYNSNTYVGNAQTSGNYTIINLATLSLPGETFNIAPGQGFFVASGAGGNVEFTPNMRTTSGEDDYIIGRSSNESYFFKLDLIGASTYSTSVFFNSNATLGLDQGYDAVVFGNNPDNYPIYTHLVEDNTGLAMAIQAVETNDFVDLVIPLGVNANQGEQITFSINTTTLSPSTEVYLDDTVANVTTLLTSSDYTLTPSTNLNGVGRFYLRYVSNALTIKDNQLNNLNIFARTTPKELVIQGLLSEKTEAKVYDIQGRLVLQSHLDMTLNQNTMDASQLSTGVYLVQLSSENHQKTQKVVIK